MKTWRTILGWQVRDEPFVAGDIIKMKEGVEEDARNWGTREIPNFTVEPGERGRITVYPTTNVYLQQEGTAHQFANVIWDQHPVQPPNSAGWVVRIQDIELA